MEKLSEICVEHRLAPKWLIVPSLRTGNSWVEALVRQGTSCINLTSATPFRFAMFLAGSELLDRQLTLLTASVSPLILDAVWDSLDADGYFRKLRKSPELLKSLAAAIEQLRLQGIDDSKLLTAEFENPQKRADMLMLLQAWEDFLKKNRIADRADVLRMAIGVVATNKVPADAIVLVSAELHATDVSQLYGLERQLIESLPAAQRFFVANPLPGIMPDVNGQSQVKFRRAIGEVNEVREVFRRCLAEQLPLDDVEILHTDAATYVPLIHEVSCLCDEDSSPFPVTFADGLPVTMTRPIRALRSWMRWLQTDFPQSVLVEMFADGLIVCDRVPSGSLAKLLRSMGIRSGKDNYLPKLNAKISLVEQHLASLRAEVNPEDPAQHEERLNRAQRKLKHLTALSRTVATLLTLADEVDDSNSATALKSVQTFVENCARTSDGHDAVAAAAILRMVADRRHWLATLAVTIDVPAWVESLIQQTRIMESGPKPGHVHVASLRTGGQSGRRHAFVVGMDDRRFPGALLQDPILLDHERTSIAESFPTTATQLECRLADVRNTLDRLQNNCLTYSWSCHSIHDGSDSYPAPELLEVYRNANGKGQAAGQGNDVVDIETLNHAAGPAISFAPVVLADALNASEVWMWQLSEPGYDRSLQYEAVNQCFDHLALGSKAIRQRVAGFSEWSGFVPMVAEDHDPFAEDGTVYSASALETLGRCPLAYFFQRRLGLSLPDDVDDDLDRWLDARQFGTLLHELFRRFMSELTAAEELPAYDQHIGRLTTMLNEAIAEFRKDVPAPSENAFRGECLKLLQIAKTFLREEQQNCQSQTPKYFEAALGMTGGDFATDLDQETPVSVELADGRTLRARGQIDRIDQISKMVYSICDYKTGSAYGYAQDSPFRGGRRVQNILYLKMVERVLRKRVNPAARVAMFEYFFPGTKANGLRRSWSAANLQPGLQVLQQLVSLDAAGAYPPTDNSDDCRYCDYQSICGNVDYLTYRSKQWLQGPVRVELKSFQELRNG